MQMVQNSNDRAYASAAEAWKDSLAVLRASGSLVPGVKDSTSVGSNFGEAVRDTTELIGYGFSLADARKRLIRSDVRPVDAGYAIANAIWVLTGANDLESIEFFNPRGSSFSDDGKILFSAPGWRIFSSNSGNLFAAAVEKLRADPSSRRAVIQITAPDDLSSVSKDISCVISLQFLIRDGRLHCITHMRSQSALMVLPYDVFLFTMIQEAVAVSLGIELGGYHHISGSYHFYADERELVEKVISTNLDEQPGMARMTSFDETVSRKLKGAFEDVRQRLALGEEVNLGSYGLDRYWQDLISEMAQAVVARLNR